MNTPTPSPVVPDDGTSPASIGQPIDLAAADGYNRRLSLRHRLEDVLREAGVPESWPTAASVKPCSKCEGEGRLKFAERCPRCEGKGTVIADANVTTRGDLVRSIVAHVTIHQAHLVQLDIGLTPEQLGTVAFPGSMYRMPDGEMDGDPPVTLREVLLHELTADGQRLAHDLGFTPG